MTEQEQVDAFKSEIEALQQKHNLYLTASYSPVYIVNNPNLLPYPQYIVGVIETKVNGK